MSRASLLNLRIEEMPVLFQRRMDKTSTVRLVQDCYDYMVELYRFRKKVGLSMSDRSPIYWTAMGYDLIMKILDGRNYTRTYQDLADLIPEGASVVDICSGTCKLYRSFLKDKGVDYLGLDHNGHFVMAARRRGVNTRIVDLFSEEIPPADYVVMCSSFYHFREQEKQIIEKLLKAARKAVLITEPVRNLSNHPFRPFARLANLLTKPGKGSFSYRYDADSFRKFAEEHNATEFVHEPGRKNAIAVFEKVDPPGT
jgi:ubiquinone/menaquinone biosynthesis C-methylase UbiE